MVTKRDDDQPTIDQQGEYRAICLGKVGRQSFAIQDVPKFQKSLEHVCFPFPCCKILHPRSLYYPLVDEAWYFPSEISIHVNCDIVYIGSFIIFFLKIYISEVKASWYYLLGWADGGLDMPPQILFHPSSAERRRMLTQNQKLLFTWSRWRDCRCFLNSSRETSLSLSIISFRYFSFADSENSIPCSSMYSARSASTSVWPFLKPISSGVSLLSLHTPRGSTLQQARWKIRLLTKASNPCFSRRRTKSCLSSMMASCRSVPEKIEAVASSWKGSNKLLKSNPHLTHLQEMVGRSLINSSFLPSFNRRASLVLVKRQKGSDPFPVAISMGDCLNSPVSGTKLGSTLQF